MPRPFIPVPNTVSIEWIFSYFSATTMENVIHVQKTSPFTLAQIQSLRAYCGTFWDSTLKNAYAQNLAFTRLRIKALDSNSAPMEDFTWSPVKIGNYGLSGTALPGGTCISMKLGTGLAGRSNRGRLYIPLTTGNQLSGSTIGDIDTTYSTSLINSWTAFIAGVQTWDATARWCVTSFRTGGAWRAAGVNNDVVSCVLVDRHVDSQRRRLLGRGI